MAVLRHENVVRLKAICVRPPCLLTEYAPNHSLADLLAAGAQKQADKVAVLTWRARVQMVRGGAAFLTPPPPGPETTSATPKLKRLAREARLH